MSGFLDALQAYRQGTLSREGLISEVERQLSQGETDAPTLFKILNEEHARAHLPGDAHNAIGRRLWQWRETPARAVAHASSETRQYGGRDASTTVLIAHELESHGPEPSAPEQDQGRTPPVTVGSLLQGRFKVIARIGEGGMSTVYKAIDLRKVEARSSDPYVAVKLLTIPLGDFAHSLALLQSEAHKLQSLPHPNIVRVIDCDRDGRTVFMTMELLVGEPLKRRLGAAEFSGMPAHEAIRIVECIASALAFAHRNGIVHGDLKPGNVIMTDRGEVKVIDFGIARLVTRAHGEGSAEHGHKVPRLTAFTPLYASPEMLEEKEADPRDDVYALACIAHELLTGQHPFEQTVATVARDAGMRVVRRAGLFRGQFRAIARGLEFERDKRTATAEQFVQELRAGGAKPAARVAAIAGISLIALLGALYFIDHARISRWLEAQRGAHAPTPVQGEVFRDCPTCPLMKALPAGRFNQGSAPDEADATRAEQPQHAVIIAYPFGIGVFEVTVGEFKEFVDATSYRSSGCSAYDGAWRERADLSWNNVGYPQTATHPVTCVSWGDARDYARWLSGRTGQRYRLASASEWEYAARAGSQSGRPWGNDAGSACAYANLADETAAQRYPGWKVQPCSDGYVYSAPVGSFAANAFGLYDMLGNAFEWVQDCWHDDYHGAPGDGSAWLDGDCTQHDLRGGSWFTAPPNVRAAARNRFDETYRSTSVGFRLVREIPK